MKLCDLGAPKERENVCVREPQASAEWETNPLPHESRKYTRWSKP